MEYNIATISIKRFLTIWIIWLLTFIVLFILWNIITYIKVNGLFFVIGFIIVFISGLAVALRFSRSEPKLLLTEINLEFENYIIKLKEIEGYYINKESPALTEIEFRDKNRDYKIASINYGKKGKEFELFLTDFVEKSNKANEDIKEMSFYDFHNKQYTFFKSILYVTFTIVILLNLVYFYLIFVKKIPLNWKLLFLNITFVWLYFFHKRNEKKYKKH
ncbi:MAG TPA: hypothetical protein PK816_13255 [Candidatus Cloacimonadota bacterium]|jgi:hypothetical protein|nr:hypothetical protein [Bacteroidales bacterium]HPM03116.1 hypothetical protein [Candidatus Cloacimonadota bacterium]HQM70654.1 hypothetical protein [Bacteroidales bacterium]